jgi:hypothetical protein
MNNGWMDIEWGKEKEEKLIVLMRLNDRPKVEVMIPSTSLKVITSS